MIAVMLVLSMAAFSQTKKVTGTVISKTSQAPLAGVSVTAKGRTVVTDSSGRFSIEASAGDGITLSFVGMTSLTIKVTNAMQNVSLALEDAGNELNQIVVTGYTTQKKADLTGAVTVVNVNELKKMPNNNPIQALQGRVPGLFITTDGSPSGGNINVMVRGISSINGTTPLYVIDGVPTKGGMHELNPNDIESIQVLKDASSASIYGSRAASGVIIITTKRAKRGELQVTGNARKSYSWYNSKLSVLDAAGYGKAVWQASANDATAYGGSPLSHYLVYDFDWAQNTAGNYTLNKISLPAYIDAPKNNMKTANTDWFNQIGRVADWQTYDISVSRGGEKGGTVFSLDYTDNNGIVKTTEFQRISARLNTDYKLINDKLQIGENLTLNTTQEVQDPGVLNAALQALPVIPVHTIDGIGWGGPWGGMNDRQNPARVLEDNKQNHYNYLRILGNVYADLELYKHLHLKSSLGIDYSNYTKRDIQLAYVSGYLNNPIDKVTMVNWSSSKLIWTNTLDYKRQIGKHNFELLAGTEMYNENNLDFSANRQTFASQDINYLYLNAGTGLKDNGGGASQIHLQSYFGKANYVFNDKYLASATIRYDGSSRFGKNNKYGLFPAFSAGWRINQENFIKKNYAFVSDLKLRYGWGKNGNQDIDTRNANKTLYQTNYSGGDPTWRVPDGTAYDLNGAGTGILPSGYQLIQRSNDDVRWETTTQSNFGLDFGFFNQKVYGSVDYFVKKTSDMLIQPAYIAVIGEGGNRWVNGASLENKGVELLLGYRGNINKDIDFDITGNIATYRNKVTKLPAEVVNSYGGNGTTDNILGHPWGAGYGYVADGLFTNKDDVANSAEQLGKGLGRIRYKDLNGDGVINEKDQTWILNPTPDFTYGLNVNVSYKGFDLTVFFQGVGNQQMNVFDVKAFTDFWSNVETGSNKGSRLLNAWSATNTKSTIPSLTSSEV